MSAHRDRDRSRGQRARGRCRDESGNILVLFAILLPLFLFTGMVVIDVGYWWANARKAQIAADACALAAARDLPQPWTPARTECMHDGRDYVLTNLPDQSGTDVEPLHVSTTVLSPFEGNASQVEATVEMRVQTFFGRFIGLGGVELTRRAVAEQAVGQGNYAIYAHSSGCPSSSTTPFTAGTSLLFGGEHHAINGRVHSNGEYRINNSGSEPFWAQHGTRVGPPDCYNDNSSSDAHFGGSSYGSYTSTEPENVTTQTWPAWWTPSEFGWVNDLGTSDTCDVQGKTIEIKENGSGTLIEVKGPPGSDRNITYSGATIPVGQTYCAWEKFTINRNNLTARMSVLSPEITVNGDNMNLTAHRGNSSGDVLFFAVPNNTNQSDGTRGAAGADVVCNPTVDNAKEVTLNGNSHVWTGVIFAPCSRIKVNVGGTTAGSAHITGTILGYEVEVNGRDFVMTGRSNFGGTVMLALDQ